jgi:outer membrane protein assembly factor BamB
MRSQVSHHRLVSFLGLVIAIFLLPTAFAADWPQFLGPTRNCTSSETGLLLSWPKEGPPKLWEKKIGEGFSGPVVAGERLILFHRLGDKETVECLDAATGKERWKYDYPTAYRDALGKGNGPRSTPLIAGNRVYTLGAEGRLHCLELETGKKVWDRTLAKDYEMRESYFGVGSSPIMDSERLIINVGAKGAGVVAFDPATGKEVWKATDDAASYSSPVAATIDGVRHVIFMTRAGLVSLDPLTGAVRFRKPWRARIDASVNAASPIVVGDEVFITEAYRTGAALFKVRKDRVEEVWKADEILSCHYNTPIHHAGHLYGLDGRQEGGGARLRCIELQTGKVRWTQERFGCASLLLADGHLIALCETGDLALVEATPQAFREKARVAVFTKLPCRAEIALANGRLYARDNDKLICWNLKK